MEKIRQASKADLIEVFTLICDLENTKVDFSKFEKIYYNNLSNTNIYYYVYEMNKKIVGFISLHIQELLHHSAKIGEIQELIVLESVRGKGIGTKLFEKVKEIGRDTDCLQIEVCCNQSRIYSHEFYLDQGMTNNHYKFCQIF